MSKKKINEEYVLPIGGSWDEFEKEYFTEQEIAESEARVRVICEIIEARKEQGMTQKELETRSGVKQPVIARMENGKTDPQLSTVLRVLAALGKTIEIVSMDNRMEKKRKERG